MVLKIEQGWSGSKVQLIDNRIVKYGGERLLKQGIKQQWFSGFAAIGVPKIFELGPPLVMEYVKGKTFWEWLPYAGPAEIEKVGVTLVEFVESNLARSTLQTFSRSVFDQKFYSSIENLPEWDFESLQHKWRGFQQKEVYLPVGPTHGDLTFSNIIFADRIWLIDFLDCYIESPILDLIKLRQDTKENIICGDCVRAGPVLGKLDEYFSNLLKKLGYESLYPLLQTLNLVRILPYVKKTKNYLPILEKIKWLK